MPRRIVSLMFMAATVGCDRVTKHFAAATLVEGPARSFLADTVRLEYSENAGAILGLGSGWPVEVRTGLFTVGTALLLLVLIVMAIRQRWSGLPLAGLVLFVSGGASNLADRGTRTRHRLHECRRRIRAHRHLQRRGCGHHAGSRPCGRGGDPLR